MSLWLCSSFTNSKIIQKKYKPKCTSVLVKPSVNLIINTVEKSMVKTVSTKQNVENI